MKPDEFVIYEKTVEIDGQSVRVFLTVPESVLQHVAAGGAPTTGQVGYLVAKEQS